MPERRSPVHVRPPLKNDEGNRVAEIRRMRVPARGGVMFERTLRY